jgi:CheY-like chemotaxis protein
MEISVPGVGSVLVVEDDADLRAAVADILEDAGFEVHVAENGQDALHVFGELGHQGERPCLVLLDLMMPVMDGREMLRRMREDAALRDVPVVVMSAGRISDEERRAASATLPKPFELDSLLEAVSRHAKASGSDGT